tara:strand:- start:1003 stop:1326 length:324 start_codon:yes stop_codon:yes gene_type:complete
MAYLYKEYIKKKRKYYIEYFKGNMKDLDNFLLQTKELGANIYAVDVTDYEGLDSVPMCLYALKSSKQGGGKKLIGAICKSGTKVVDGYDSGFQSKGRKFLTLDIQGG